MWKPFDDLILLILLHSLEIDLNLFDVHKTDDFIL